MQTIKAKCQRKNTKMEAQTLSRMLANDTTRVFVLNEESLELTELLPWMINETEITKDGQLAETLEPEELEKLEENDELEVITIIRAP